MKIIVAGAGAGGLKIVQAVDDSQESGLYDHEIVGIIDDNLELKDKEFYGYPVLGTSSELDQIEQRLGPLNNLGLVCGIGEPNRREGMIKRIAHRFGIFPNIIHPSANVSKYVRLGKGNVFCQNVVVQPEATIGDFNVFKIGSILGSSSEVTDYCMVGTNAVLSCWSKLLPYTTLGAGSNVAEKIVVGSHCIVGPNSFLTRDLEDGSTVLGVPARKIS